MSSFFPSSLVVKKITLSDDNEKVLSNTDIPFYSMDIQCQSNAIYIGIGGAMDFILQPSETYWIYNANMRDFLIKNYSSGNNGVAVIIASVPNKFVEQALKVGFRGI